MTVLDRTQQPEPPYGAAFSMFCGKFIVNQLRKVVKRKLIFLIFREAAIFLLLYEHRKI